MRQVGAWAFYLLGDAVYRMSFGWMPWPIYRTYNTCMTLSDRIQGDGKGPWRDA